MALIKKVGHTCVTKGKKREKRKKCWRQHRMIPLEQGSRWAEGKKKEVCYLRSHERRERHFRLGENSFSFLFLHLFPRISEDSWIFPEIDASDFFSSSTRKSES